MAKHDAKPVRPGRAAAEERRSTSKAADPKGFDGMIGYNLRLAYNMQVQRFQSVGGAFNIRPAQFGTLKMIYANPGLKQSELTEALQKKHANIVTMLGDLEQRGLLVRVPDRNDRRSRVLRLTPKGRQLIVKLLDRHARLEKNLRDTFGARNREQLVRLLEKFRRLDPDPNLDDMG